MTMPTDDDLALALLERRLRIILPAEYQDCYEDIQQVSMGSAGLKFGSDHKVLWNEMWATFCDLAMAGGPPHKGSLLEPGSAAAIDAQPDRYREVVEEICRGIRLVTELSVEPSPNPGWVRVECLDEAMAEWLLRAIVMENISSRRDGSALDLPAAPEFRLEKEIKNVITAVAKTCHYWIDHTWDAHQAAIGMLFLTMAAESPLIEPALASDRVPADAQRAAAAMMAESIHQNIGRPAVTQRYDGWFGVEYQTVQAAVWMMRAMVARNVLSRREGTVLFVPINVNTDPDGSRVVNAVAFTHRLAMAKGVLPPME